MLNDEILRRAEQMLQEGADILDLGGQSSRPGSIAVGEEIELERLLEPISMIKKEFPDTILSVDTYRSRVAAEAVEAGASIVNDISGGNLDLRMLEAVAGLGVPYICMHMKGDPETMQKEPQYDNLMEELLRFFADKLKQCRLAGINDIIIDPGFGFGKTRRHNFEILEKLSLFRIFERPVMLGISRKSTIYKTLSITAEEALNGTTVLNTIGLINGADILRVHDVEPALEVVKLVGAYRDQAV
jgi:dihydropteroate synthase